jgi:CRP/FNR family transcriptional regulator, cyclic AMP receptor protein
MNQLITRNDAQNDRRKDVRKDVLKKAYLFQDLHEQELNRIAAISEPQHYSPGEHLFSQKEDPDALYVIQYGSVKSEAFGPESDHEYGYGILGNGSLLGEASFQSLSPRSTSAIALEHVEVIRIPFSSLKQVLDADPALSVKVHRALTKHLGKVFHKSMSDLTRLREKAYSPARHEKTL